MYNTKLKVFQNGTVQCTFYSEPIITDADRKNKPDKFTEFINTLLEIGNDIVENPFNENRKEYLPQFNLQRRATELTEQERQQMELEERLRHERSLRTSRNRSLKKIMDYGRSNVWDWFVTFTFAESDSFSREDYEVCRRKISKWFKNVRARLCPNIKYLVIPEQHQSGAWHFHALVSNCDGLNFTKAINQKETYIDRKGHLKPNKYFGEYLRVKYPSGDFVYNIQNYESGFSTATRIKDTRKAVSYIVKYITKDLSKLTFGKRRYLPSNNLNLPDTYNAIIPNAYLNDMLCKIEYTFGVKLSIDAIKTYVVDVPNYYNSIMVFEFNPLQEGGESNAQHSLHSRFAQWSSSEKEENIMGLFAYT